MKASTEKWHDAVCSVHYYCYRLTEMNNSVAHYCHRHHHQRCTTKAKRKRKRQISVCVLYCRGWFWKRGGKRKKERERERESKKKAIRWTNKNETVSWAKKKRASKLHHRLPSHKMAAPVLLLFLLLLSLGCYCAEGVVGILQTIIVHLTIYYNQLW